MFSKCRIDTADLIYSERDEESYSQQGSQSMFDSQTQIFEASQSQAKHHPMQYHGSSSICGSDYWSQSSYPCSSEMNEQDDVRNVALKKYVTKTSISNSNLMKGNTENKNKKSYKQMMQEREGKSISTDQRYILDIFVNLLREHCNEVKKNMEATKDEIFKRMGQQTDDLSQVINQNQECMESVRKKITEMVDEFTANVTQESKEEIIKVQSEIQEQKSIMQLLEKQLKLSNTVEKERLKSENVNRISVRDELLKITQLLQSSTEKLSESHDQVVTVTKSVAHDVLEATNNANQQWTDIYDQIRSYKLSEQPKDDNSNIKVDLEEIIRLLRSFSEKDKEHILRPPIDSADLPIINATKAISSQSKSSSKNRNHQVKRSPENDWLTEGESCWNAERCDTFVPILADTDSDLSDIGTTQITTTSMPNYFTNDRIATSPPSWSYQTRITSFAKFQRHPEEHFQRSNTSNKENMMSKKTCTKKTQPIQKRKLMAEKRRQYAEMVFEFKDDTEFKIAAATLRRQHKNKKRR